MSEQGTDAGVMPSPSETGSETGATPIPTQAGTVVIPQPQSDAGATPSPADSSSDRDRRDADPEAQRDGDRQRDASLSPDDLRGALEASRQAERKAARELKRYQDAERQREEAAKSDLQKAIERAERAEARAADMERTELAKDIAREAGIPTLWHRLSGSDSRSLRADALRVREELQALGTLPVTPGMEGGVRSLGNPPQPNSMDDLIRGRMNAR